MTIVKTQSSKDRFDDHMTIVRGCSADVKRILLIDGIDTQHVLALRN